MQVARAVRFRPAPRDPPRVGRQQKGGPCIVVAAEAVAHEAGEATSHAAEEPWSAQVQGAEEALRAFGRAMTQQKLRRREIRYLEWRRAASRDLCNDL